MKIKLFLCLSIIFFAAGLYACGGTGTKPTNNQNDASDAEASATGSESNITDSQSDSSSEETDNSSGQTDATNELAAFYTDIERYEDEYVYVSFKTKLDKNASDFVENFALALLGGLHLVYENSNTSDTLSVLIFFTDGSSALFYTYRTNYVAFLNGEITADQLLKRINVYEGQ